jgi:hypothetical protein
VSRQKEVTAAIQPALDAMCNGRGQGCSQNCLFIDRRMKELSGIRAFAGQPWQHSIVPNAGYMVIIVSKTDMQAAQKTLMGVRP